MAQTMSCVFVPHSKCTLHCIKVQKEFRVLTGKKKSDQDHIETGPEDTHNYFSISCITFLGDCTILASDRTQPGKSLELYLRRPSGGSLCL